MTIQKLDNFAENGDKNLTGIDVQQGFIQAEKPARQWFNWLFNSITKKINEAVDGVNVVTQAITDIVITTDKIADSAVTLVKIDPNIKILGNMIAKDADLNTPKLSATYAATTLDAPNINLAADGTLKRSNDPLNAATRKVGTASGNLAEYDTNGRLVNTKAIGDGQTWQDVSASRAANTVYTNSTGRPITAIIGVGADSSSSPVQLSADGITWVSVGYGSGVASMAVTVVVPSGWRYRATFSLRNWVELR